MKYLTRVILSLLLFLVCSESGLAYTIDSKGNYILSEEEMVTLTKQNEINQLEIERLTKQLELYQALPVNEMIESLTTSYSTLLDDKELQIQTLTELNTTLSEYNKELEMEVMSQKFKSAAYKTSSYAGWLVAVGLGIGWAASD